MKKTLIIISTVVLSFATSGQQFDWIVSSGYYAQCHSGACDSSGSVYFVGEFVKEIAFGDTVLYASGFKLEIFLVKYDPLGNLIWATKDGGPGNDRGYSLSKSNDLLYVTGYFMNEVLFGGTTQLTSAAGKDVFVSIYNFNGVFQWADSHGGQGEDWGFLVQHDPWKGCYLAGFHTDDALFGDTVLQVNHLQNMYFGRFHDSSCTNYISIPRVTKAFSISPNPAVAKTRILFPQGTWCKDLRISLYSSMGVLQHPVINEPEAEIDITGFKPGVYLVNVTGCNFSWTQKLVILSP